MNTISFYQPLDGKTSDLAAFITECLLACGYSFKYYAENGEIEVSGYINEKSIIDDAATYNLLTEPEE